MAVDAGNIPGVLKALDQWVVWAYEHKPSEDKPTKVPYNAGTGHLASSTDPTTWTPFDQAIGTYASNPKWSGIGFVVTKDDPIVGWDFDHCLDPVTGAITDEEVQEFVYLLDRYTEITPSDEGLRVFTLGELPPGRRKKGGREVYSSGRFLTLTGRRLPGTPETVNERSDEILAVHARIFGEQAQTTGSSGHVEVPRDTSPLAEDDWALIGKAKASKKGEKFAKLWEGQWAELGYPSPSEADQALANYLAFWTNNDAGRIDRLFRASKLIRQKWDKKHGEGTYGQITIEKAIKNTPEGYTPPSDNRGLDLGGPSTDGAGAEASSPRRRFTLISALDFLNRPRPSFLVDDLLVRGTLAGLVGTYASYKSFHALDLSLSVAAGLPWLGRETKQAPAVFISGEGSGGLTDRMRAWSLHRNTRLPVSFRLLTDAVQFMNPADVGALLEEIGGLPEPPGLVVVDTVARCMVGGDENSAKDMGQFVAGVDRLREATGATVMLIHHVTKSTGTVRGSTALPGALDTMIEVRGDGETAELTCGKQKDCAEFDPIHLRRHVVEIEPFVSSLVFDLTDGRVGAGPTGSAPRVLRALVETFGPEGATSTQWQRVCADLGISERSFFRAKKDLEEARQVTRTGGRGGRFTANCQVTATAAMAESASSLPATANPLDWQAGSECGREDENNRAPSPPVRRS